MLEVYSPFVYIRRYCLYCFHLSRELRWLIQTIPTHTTFHIPQIAGYDNKRYDALWGNCLSAVEQSSRILAESHESPLCNCKDTNKRAKCKIKNIFYFNFRARVSYLKIRLSEDKTKNILYFYWFDYRTWKF